MSRYLDDYQHSRHVCKPAEAVSEQDLERAKRDESCCQSSEQAESKALVNPCSCLQCSKHPNTRENFSSFDPISQRISNLLDSEMALSSSDNFNEQ
jgi:hypothetical protein